MPVSRMTLARLLVTAHLSTIFACLPPARRTSMTCRVDSDCSTGSAQCNLGYCQGTRCRTDEDCHPEECPTPEACESLTGVCVDTGSLQLCATSECGPDDCSEGDTCQEFADERGVVRLCSP